MERPDISPLSQLSLGDCFHFAYRALRDERGDHVPLFELTEIGGDFCAVRLTDSSGAVSATTTRLLKTTLVRKIFVPEADSLISSQSTDGLIVEAVMFDDSPKSRSSSSRHREVPQTQAG